MEFFFWKRDRISLVPAPCHTSWDLIHSLLPLPCPLLPSFVIPEHTMFCPTFTPSILPTLSPNSRSRIILHFTEGRMNNKYGAVIFDWLSMSHVILPCYCIKTRVGLIPLENIRAACKWCFYSQVPELDYSRLLFYLSKPKSYIISSMFSLTIVQATDILHCQQGLSIFSIV